MRAGSTESPRRLRERLRDRARWPAGRPGRGRHAHWDAAARTRGPHSPEPAGRSRPATRAPLRAPRPLSAFAAAAWPLRCWRLTVKSRSEWNHWETAAGSDCGTGRRRRRWRRRRRRKRRRQGSRRRHCACAWVATALADPGRGAGAGQLCGRHRWFPGAAPAYPESCASRSLTQPAGRAEVLFQDLETTIPGPPP